MICVSLRLTGAAFQIIGTILVFHIYRRSDDMCRSPANRYHHCLRYTAPVMIGAALQLKGAALQLIGSTFIFDMPPLR